MLSDLLYRLRALLYRHRSESELDQELSFHLESEIEKYVASGMPRDEAIARARRAFGGRSQAEEACRDARGLGLLETTWKDICHGVRSLRKSPLFTSTVILSLALGIGANTAVFTLLRASLWKPLPIRNARQIFQIQQCNPSNESAGEFGFSYVLVKKLSAAAAPFGEVLAKARFESAKFGRNRDSRERVVGEAVSANFFSALSIQPLLGRTFEPGDDSVLGGKHVALLSERFWRWRFESNSSALGQTIWYKETPYTVVGVAQPGFNGVEAETRVDLWVPITSDVPKSWLDDAHVNWLRLLVRLRPNYNLGQAQAALNTTFLAHLKCEILPGEGAHFKPLLEGLRIVLRPASSGLSTTGRQYERPLLILMAIVVAVLLMSCANVANLVMARNRARRNEIAVRRVLGASRGRIVSQLLVESLLLALFGTALGIVLAIWTCHLLLSLLPQTQPPLAFDVRPDFVVLGFAALLGLMTAILFGLAPALGESGTEESLTLRSGHWVTSSTLRGKFLVTGQIAVSLLLLIGAGLFLGTLRNLSAIDLGFRPEHVLTFDLSFPKDTPAARLLRTYEQIRQQLESSPGVIAASFAWPDVYDRGGWSLGIEADGHPSAPGEDNEAGVIATGTDFFRTLQIGLLQGRYFTLRDLANNSLVAVVNQSFARHHFPSASAIGQRIRVPGERPQVREIVGVVRDAKHYGAREKAWRMLYLPAEQAQGSFLVRSGADEQFLRGVIRKVVADVDASAQIEQIRPLQSIVDDMAGRERMIAALSTAFAILAMLLASVGLYGVMTYAVARRTAELGIRVALGAQRVDIQWLVLSETAKLVVTGVILGVAASLALSRFVTGLLYGVQANSFSIFAGSMFILGVVAGIAAFFPAWRASRTDPMVALRYE